MHCTLSFVAKRGRQGTIKGPTRGEKPFLQGLLFIVRDKHKLVSVSPYVRGGSWRTSFVGALMLPAVLFCPN
jgi:hypothetical protein